MKNKRNLVVVALAFLAFAVLSSCVSSQIETDEDGKRMYSTRKISSRDFYAGNFFIDEIGDSSFNLKIFYMMKNMISNGTAKYLIANDKTNEVLNVVVKKGEMIDCFDSNDANERLIVYYIFDKKSRHFVEYHFALAVNERQYNSYAESLRTLASLIAECTKNIELCDKNIKSCNEIIEKCSNPTIQKSRVVSVPYTSEIIHFVPGKAGDPGTHSKTETYTEYRDEIEYYTVPNPNYNPNAVSKAKKDLQSWNNSKTGWTNKKDAAYKEKSNLPLPFVLEWWLPGSNFEK